VGSSDQRNTIWDTAELEVLVISSMGQPGLSMAEKVELWQQWDQRQSLSEIRRTRGKRVGSIEGLAETNQCGDVRSYHYESEGPCTSRAR
jgi:hypothetical protein